LWRVNREETDRLLDTLREVNRMDVPTFREVNRMDVQGIV
jgi:hypothetical protein